MIMVVSLGLRPCPEYTVSVDSVYAEGGQHLVAVVHSSGPQACGCLGELAAPVDVVRMPRNERVVRFEDRPMRNACLR